MTLDREDILICRIVDRESSDADWAELEALAATDPGVWRRLALAEREHAVLTSGVDEAIAAADSVELPRVTIDATHRFHARWRAWGGWAVAALVALGWGTMQGVLPATRTPGGQTAGLRLANLSPEEAFNEYLARGIESGRVLAELPTVMIEARPTEAGDAIEITVLRRVIERTRVTGAYRVATDEAGELRVVPAVPVATDPSDAAGSSM